VKGGLLDQARWQQVKTIFQDACDREPADRGPWLDQLCAGDVELRAAVDDLLAAHDSAGSFLDGTGRPDFASLDANVSASSTRIGPYRIVREIGRGGMGAVYLAERDEPGFRKTVAIKVVRHDSQLLRRRFSTETQILAALEHPGIARLYDGGTTDEGLPYFVMEYVAGANIIEYCDHHSLSIADRLRLFRRVCDAVQYAHQSFIVHRDLKPSNILVTADGEPKLLDFGIAKLLVQDLQGGPPEETLEITRLLTPQYASPEHVHGQPVTTASDVYSLGVILYELVSGCRPYRITSDRPADVERIVCDTDPPAPSVTAPYAWRRLLRGDVDNIVLKALRKEPRDRYGTAAALAEDLRRHLEGFPVRAQPDSRAYRATKFVGRHRGSVIAVGLIVLSLAGGLALALYEARLARAAQARSERHFADVRRLANEYLFEVDAAIRFLPGSTQARELVVSKALQYLDTLTRESGGDPQLQRELASGYERIGDIQGGALLEGNLGQLSAARVSYERAMGIRRQLYESHPGAAADAAALADAYVVLGRSWELLGDHRAAAAAAEEAIRLGESALRSDNDARAQLRLGQALNLAFYPYLELGDRVRAQALLDRALALWRGLVADRPDDREAREGLMRCLHGLGVVRSSLNEHQAAADNLGQSAALGEELLRENPRDERLSRQLAQTLLTLGNVLVDAGQPQAAIAAIERGIARRKKEIEAAPDDATSLVFLRNAHHMLGFAEQASGKFDAAAKDYLQAIALIRRVLIKEPASNLLRQALAVSCQSVAETYEAAAQSRTGEEKRRFLREARSWYGEAAAAFDSVERAGALEADNRDRPRIVRERLRALAPLAQQ